MAEPTQYVSLLYIKKETKRRLQLAKLRLAWYAFKLILKKPCFIVKNPRCTTGVLDPFETRTTVGLKIGLYEGV